MVTDTTVVESLIIETIPKVRGKDGGVSIADLRTLVWGQGTLYDELFDAAAGPAVKGIRLTDREVANVLKTWGYRKIRRWKNGHRVWLWYRPEGRVPSTTYEMICRQGFARLAAALDAGVVSPADAWKVVKPRYRLEKEGVYRHPVPVYPPRVLVDEIVGRVEQAARQGRVLTLDAALGELTADASEAPRLEGNEPLPVDGMTDQR